MFCAAAKSLQSCSTLCNPTDGSSLGSAIPGILQARTLEWAAISYSDAWKWKVKGKSLSRVWLLVTPWTAAYQAPPSMGVSRQEYWSGMPLPSPFPMTRLYQNFVWVKVKLKKTSITAKILLSESCKLFPCITMQIDKMKLDALDFCLMGELILNVILYYPLGY